MLVTQVALLCSPTHLLLHCTVELLWHTVNYLVCVHPAMTMLCRFTAWKDLDSLSDYFTMKKSTHNRMCTVCEDLLLGKFYTLYLIFYNEEIRNIPTLEYALYVQIYYLESFRLSGCDTFQ